MARPAPAVPGISIPVAASAATGQTGHLDRSVQRREERDRQRLDDGHLLTYRR